MSIFSVRAEKRAAALAKDGFDGASLGAGLQPRRLQSFVPANDRGAILGETAFFPIKNSVLAAPASSAESRQSIVLNVSKSTWRGGSWEERR